MYQSRGNQSDCERLIDTVEHTEWKNIISARVLDTLASKVEGDDICQTKLELTNWWDKN